MTSTGWRCAVVTAPIGAGHDLPAEVLRDGLRAARPEADVAIVDGLAAMGRFIERVVNGGSDFDTRLGNVAFDLGHRLIHDWGPTRRGIEALGTAIGGRGLARAASASDPAVVVSTYPGTTEVLGRLRARGRFRVPVVAAITDVAALWNWAHPGIDLHLVTQAEAIEEVRSIAGADAEVVVVRGLSDPRFATPPDRATARASLGLPPLGATVVAVSGGGWAVGDLEGATEEALALDDGRGWALVLCGQDAARRAAIDARFAASGRVRSLGFTDRMPDVLAAADVLVHSTAGLTVMEALAVGCPVVSYGWGRGHIRANNAAFLRHGIAEVAEDRPALARALRRALPWRGAPDPAFAALPTAAEVVLARFG